MAHQIENMFYVGETPWHGLGTILPDDRLPMRDYIAASGLNWRAKKVPLLAQDNGEVSSHSIVTRESDGKRLGVVGPTYEILQNEDAFAQFQPMVDAGLVKLETAGSLAGGRKVWILGRIVNNGELDVVSGDTIRRYVMLSNGHDGTLACRFGFTDVRVVCANTMAAAHGSEGSQLIRFRHSASIVQNLEKLREIMDISRAQFVATTEQFRQLARHDVNAEDLRKYVKTVLGHEHTEDKDLPTQTENKIEVITSLFEYGRGNDLPGVKGTVWAAYNAVTEYLTHAAGSDADKRYHSLWFGQGAQRNQLALDLALKLAA